MRRVVTAAAVAGLVAATACTSSTPHSAASAARTDSGLVRVDSEGVARPDPALSPGSSASGASATDVCSPTYIQSVALASDTDRRDAFARYGLPYPAAQTQYRVDHVIPAELGGDNSPANLWPEPVTASTADRKNALANRLHDLVCSGAVPLATAQQQMATDWYAAWKTYVAPLSASPSPSTAPLAAAAPAPTATTPSAVPSTRRPTPSPTPTPEAPSPLPAPTTVQAAAVAPTPTPQSPAPTSPTATPTMSAPPASSEPEERPVQGQSCSPIGATGVSGSGRPLVCVRVNRSDTGQWRGANS